MDGDGWGWGQIPVPVQLSNGYMTKIGRVYLPVLGGDFSYPITE